jgi:hypothetical protein
MIVIACNHNSITDDNNNIIRVSHFLVSISRCWNLASFISERILSVSCMLFVGAKTMASKYSAIFDNSTARKIVESVEEDLKQKTWPVPRELLSVFYVVGIMGSFLALLHLCNSSKRNKNVKQIFMLK